MDFEEYKKTCKLYSCYYRFSQGFVFAIFFDDHIADIVFSKDRTINIYAYTKSDPFLCDLITKGKTKEELYEFLSQVLRYEILKLRKDEKITNFSEEAYFYFSTYRNLNNDIQEAINEIFKTDITPYEVKEKQRIRFLLNSNLPSGFKYILNFILLYKFIKDDTFIKI